MKEKLAADFEVKRKLKKLMVETVQQMQAASPPPNISFTITRKWMTSWADMLSSRKHAKPTKPQENIFKHLYE